MRFLITSGRMRLDEMGDVCDLMKKTAQDAGCGSILEGVSRFPRVISVRDPELEGEVSVIGYELDGREHVNCALRILMPCNRGSELIWMPWLPRQRQPLRNPGDFHHIRIVGKPTLQPRATKCYNHAYLYSGQVHEVEEITPPEIQELYRETNAIFGLPHDGVSGANMCLENDYANGRHSIGEHEDDERSFGKIHDVYCWVTGPASRMGIFRVSKKVKKQTPGERELFRIELPDGFYAMLGKHFQAQFSHEFPQQHKGLFDRICKGCEADPDTFPGFPIDVPDSEEGASRKGIVQAGWIQENRDLILRKIDADGFKKEAAGDRPNFEKWCLHRTSYTLRNFDPEEVPA